MSVGDHGQEEVQRVYKEDPQPSTGMMRRLYSWVSSPKNTADTNILPRSMKLLNGLLSRQDTWALCYDIRCRETS